MKLKLSALVIALSLTACSSMKTGNGTNSSTPIANQKLSTSFVGEKVKIETKCAWFSFGSDCQVVAIEATGTAPSFGNTTSNMRNAFTRAEMKAQGQVARFLNEEVTTNRVQSTIAKNIEKATDKVKSGKADESTTVEMTDKEANNVSLRENNNETVVNLTETIHTSAKSILSGFVKVDEKVVGDQEVSVTIRWDVDSGVSRKQLLKAMQ
jgi:hypothetical protein